MIKHEDVVRVVGVWLEDGKFLCEERTTYVNFSLGEGDTNSMNSIKIKNTD